MPPVSRAARVAFVRLLGRCAVALRVGCALAFGLATAVGAPSWAGFLVTGALAAWAAVTARPALRSGWRPWMVAGDVLLAGAVCLGHGGLVPAAALTDGTSWVFLVASTAVIVSQLGARPLPGVLATIVVPVAYAAGLVLAPAADPPGSAVLLIVQGVLLGGLMVPIRRAATAADTAIDSAETVERDAAVRAARRAEEREHNRLLHDSVSATLTVVAADGIGGPSATLRAQAVRDLAVLERIGAPPAAAATGDLTGWLAPVLAAAGPAVQVRAAAPVAVPAAVGAALAGAVAEALRNAARHAAGAAVRVRTEPLADGVLVELCDDGPGFDPAAVPASRRGVRESLVGRMRAVGGGALVESGPGRGTRVELRWPVAADPRPAERPLGELVARTYGRGVALAVVWLVAVWHVASDLPTLLTWAGTYRSVGVEVAAWLALAGVAVVGGVRLLRGIATRATAWALAAVVLVASAAATLALPGDALLGGAGWAWGAAGWFGVLVLLRRPPAELVVLVLANSAVTLGALAYGGSCTRVGAARFGIVLYGTAALQLTVALGARALDATGRRAAEVAAVESAVRRQRQVADELHAGRQQRYGELHRTVGPLLGGLATGALDPADRTVRHRCAVAASRLRRLFAETDDVPEPLLHELRACADIADRRGVLVDLQVRGRLPALDLATRRSLTEAPLVALAGAERHARVTVVGRRDEVAVGVVADGDTTGWVEVRWQR